MRACPAAPEGVSTIGEQPQLGVLTDEAHMRMALAEARAALAHEDVPVGAIAVLDGRVIGRAHNQRELLGDPTAHAEMIALTQAAEAVGHWRLDGVTLFVTLEPCAMCAGAMVLARIARLVYGADDPKTGAVRSLYQLLDDERLNHQVPSLGGVLADECGQLLRDFFRQRRGTSDE
jgi:tRNA(adenine34) deaminase